MRVLERWALALSLLVCVGTALAQEAGVENFTPQGQAKAVRQVTARFATPMTAFGDLRGPMPFEVDCSAPGAGRWVDVRTWSYDFERDLPGASSCRFTLRAGLRERNPYRADAEAFGRGGDVVQALLGQARMMVEEQPLDRRACLGRRTAEAGEAGDGPGAVR